MNQKWRTSDISRITFPRVSLVVFTASIIMNLTGCFLKQDRTTTVYGTITDQNGQPVDSILVIVQGMRYLNLEILKQAYTGSGGNYEILVDVPKRYSSINLTIPFLLKENPKYQTMYKGKKTSKNGNATSNCCISSVGEKTKYDFQLIPK